LRSLEADDVISITRDSSGVPQYVELSDAERTCGRENYDFYCFLIWPFIEASWLGAVSLLGLSPPLDGPRDTWIDNKKAQDSAQLVSYLKFSCGEKTSVARNANIFFSLAKLSITREIFHISKPSTKKPSRTLISALRKRELFSWLRARSIGLGHR
jgi:hypothetical protein